MENLCVTKDRYFFVKDVNAKVVGGKAEITIRDQGEFDSLDDAKKCASKSWYANQMALLEFARLRNASADIPLTFTTKTSSSCLRLGGGFLQIEKTRCGERIAVPKRRSTGLRPSMLCESGGVHDKEDYVLMMIQELAEIARFTDKILYIPRLEKFFDYEVNAPELLKEYNEALEREMIEEARHIGICGLETEHIDVRTYTTASMVCVKYDDRPPIHGEVVAEADTSSLEFVGAVKYDMRGVPIDSLRYKDTEREWDRKNNRPKPEGELRETLLINLYKDCVQSWPEARYPIDALSEAKPDRETKEVAHVLKNIDLKETDGRYANEKLCAILKRLPAGTHFERILHPSCFE